MAANNTHQEYLITGEENNINNNPGILSFFMKDFYEKFNDDNNIKVSIKFAQIIDETV